MHLQTVRILASLCRCRCVNTKILPNILYSSIPKLGYILAKQCPSGPINITLHPKGQSDNCSSNAVPISSWSLKYHKEGLVGEGALTG